ncbi:helix-turn-helix domain-containing protein [Candidatus Micrarchaeota archaeon]|nr:helix-turn-helix domain-containing protein [Candidatus Micrarchaeota archaeon]
MGIDMTCIDLSVDDLLGCSFGLTKREVAVLLCMLQGGGWMPVSKIARISQRDRSVVQRAILTLVNTGIVERSQRNREGGGYEYLYRASGKAALKRSILDKSRAFCARVAAQVRQW